MTDSGSVLVVLATLGDVQKSQNCVFIRSLKCLHNVSFAISINNKETRLALQYQVQVFIEKTIRELFALRGKFILGITIFLENVKKIKEFKFFSLKSLCFAKA